MAGHIPVLKEETVDGLSIRDDSTVVDCTLGGGGHAEAILTRLGARGVYLGIDADPKAVEAAERLRTHQADVRFVNANFSDLRAVLDQEELVHADALLADLGWRSDQFEEGGKGFSFAADEPLLMTYGNPETYVFTATDIVNDWEETSIADVIYGYGEERFARRIARAIVEAREERPIETARELAEIVISAVPGPMRHGRIHPATKTFQALRIAVNDELGVLRNLLKDSMDILAPSGRMAIISFHSLEDRIVKQFFQEAARSGVARLVTKKPITASREELLANPRARSAKLRIIEKN